MLLPDDLWDLFGCDSGPGVLWCAAAVLVPVLPLVVLLGCVGWELVRPSRGS